MKASDILKIADLGEQVKQLSSTASEQGIVKVNYIDLEKQWDQSLHDVMDEAIRLNKEVSKPSGVKDTDGKDIYATSYENVARIPVPFQKIIVRRAVSFLLNKGISRQDNAETATEQNVISIIDQIWKDNKLDYKTKQLARLVFSECEAAEIWYFVKEETFWGKIMAMLKLKSIAIRARVKIVSNSLGDTLYPHFDETGDMDAFSREYSSTIEGKQVKYFEVYTAEKIIKMMQSEGVWSVTESVVNILKKIPVIYYSQPYPEWHDVQELITRFETMLSNFADSNDYFGSPMVKVKGTVVGFAEKDEQGKVIQLEGEGADADYMSWDAAPESIKIEKETLQDLIYSMTQTPDISFGKMMNMGNVSGISRKLMFLDAHLKCFDKEETFGESIQRRLNLLRTIVGVIASKYATDAENIEISPVFTPYLPSSEEDLVNTLSVAVGGKPIMSQETAVKLNPMIEDPDEELKRVQGEAAAEFQEPVVVTGQTINPNNNQNPDDDET